MYSEHSLLVLSILTNNAMIIIKNIRKTCNIRTYPNAPTVINNKVDVIIEESFLSSIVFNFKLDELVKAKDTYMHIYKNYADV